MTYIDASDCGVSAGIGGMSGSGGGAGNNNWYGQWAIVGVTWSNDCIISRAILDAYGNPTFTQNGSPRSQSAVVNCPEGGMNPLNPGQNQSNPWGNSTNPPNIDPLHWDPSNSGGGGGGGGGPSSSSTDGNNQEGTVIAVLPPTRLEREIESFFDNLTEEQKDCLSPGFGQPQNSLKKNITAYFKKNQAFQKFGFDSSTITPEAKAFAISAITALMNSGEVDFDDEIINELTGKALCAYNKLLSSGVSNFHNMITDLFIEFGDSNIGGRDLTFKMSSDLPNNFGGKTQVDSNGNYHILINENLMNTLSSIEVAAILVHEMAHAFLGKHYIDYNSSFTELYEKYINDTGIQNYSHDIMKDQFINRMATAIKNYDSSIFSNFEDYKILASQGVFELTNDQKEDLLTVKLLSRNNDKNCD